MEDSNLIHALMGRCRLPTMNAPPVTDRWDLPVLVASSKRMNGVAALDTLTPAAGQPYGRSAKGAWAVDSMEVFSLAEMCHTPFPTDSHFVSYTVEGLSATPRLTKPVLGAVLATGRAVMCNMVVVDVDLHHQLGYADKMPWTELESAQVEAMNDKVEFLLAFLSEREAPANVWYRTTNGLRFIHVLGTQFPAGSSFEAYLRRLLRHYEDAGIKPDASCVDWTRFFRCPSVVREDSGVYTTEVESQWDEFTTPLLSELRTAVKDTAILDIKPLHRGQPTPEEAKLLLEDFRPGSKILVKTAAYEQCKSTLSGHAYEVAIKGRAIGEPGNRDTSLVRTAGDVVQCLHRHPWATPEIAYAMLLPATEALGPDEDWCGKLWAKILEFWARDTAVSQMDTVVRTEKVVLKQDKALTAQEQFLEGVRTWLPAAREVSDGQTLELLTEMKLGVLKHQHKGYCYVLERSGFYDITPCNKDSLRMVLRDREMEWLIPIEYEGTDKQGRVVQHPIKTDSILDSHARSFSEEVCTIKAPGNHVDLDDSLGRTTVCLVPFKFRDDLKPEFSEDVDQWLRSMAPPDRWDDFIRAITYLLAIYDGPTAAVAITGPPGTGKKMIALGVAECFSAGSAVNGDVLVERFNGSLMKSPLIWIDEGIKRGSDGIDPADRFRKIVTGGAIPIERKGLEVVDIAGVHRILVTANNLDALSMLGGRRGRTSDDWAAIGERLVHFRAENAAAHYLGSRGGLRFTDGWVQSDTGKTSQFVVAKHLIWHYYNTLQRNEDGTLVRMGKRLLFEGSSTSQIIYDLESGSGLVPDIALVINSMLSGPVNTSGALLMHKDRVVYYLTAKVVEAVQSKFNYTGQDIRQELKSMRIEDRESHTPIRVGGRKERWKRMDALKLRRIVSEHSSLSPTLEKMEE